MRAGIRTRWVGIGVLTVVTAVGATAAPSWSAGSAGRAAPEPGAVVVADQEQGAVLALGRDGRSQVVLDELGAVRGVVVLSDGTVVAADSEAGTLVATAGRFGDDRVELATGLESPEGLAVAGGGRLYVTSFSEGTLSRVDISSGRVESLAADLDGPSAVLAQREPRPAARVAVAEWFGGRVADLRRTGSRAGALVRGLERPAGLALDGDGVLYVSDRAEGTVTAVDLDGARRVVVELDAPAGLALDPAAPAAGQSYDLVVATAAGVVRVDPGSGATDELDPLPTGVGLVVAPDEFIVAGAPATPVAEAGRAAGGAAGGGDPVVAASGADVDPVLVGLIAIAVFLAGIAVVSGVQLWRGRGDEEEGDRFVGMSRGERRRARRTERAVQAAERKTAKEVAKAEKRAAKLAPEPPGGAEGPSAPPSRKERREAERRRAAEARDEQARAKAQAKQQVEQAKRDASQAKADERAAAKAARASTRRGRRSTAVVGQDAGDPDTAGDDLGDGPGAADGPPAVGPDRVPLFAPPAAAPLTAGPFLESLFADEGPSPSPAPGDAGPGEPPPPGPDAGDDARREAPAGWPTTGSVVADPGEAAAVGPHPDDDAPAAPGTAGAGEGAPEAVPGDPAAVGPAAEAATGAEPPAALEPLRPPEPSAAVPEPSAPGAGLAVPPASAAPARPPGSALEPAHDDAETERPDLTEQVARQVAPPRGLRGRRRAKRRARAAEHRHRQLRALNAIIDVPPPALPAAPVRPALGVASAASVANPDDRRLASPAALGPGWAGSPVPAAPATGDPAGSAPAPGPGASGDDVGVPWPGAGHTGGVVDAAPAWPDEPPP